MTSENFNRLLSQQASDIEATEREITKLEKFKSDYESVSNKIQELQKSVYKEAYIPFSRKALVRGRLIHTNELLVYLGGTDDYFAELSVYETVQLLSRRIKQLEVKLDGLNKQKTLLSDRIAYTKGLVSQKSVSVSKNSSNPSTIDPISESFENEKEIEIREEYDSDAEIEWKKKHSLSRKQERLKNASQSSPVLTTRKVSFDLSDQVFEDKTSDSEKSPTSESEFEDNNLSTIYFKHSDIPSLVPRKKVVDLSTLTVAEAVNFADELCKIQGDSKILSVEPFGDICERVPTAPTEPNTSSSTVNTEKKRCSQFRSSRMRDSKLS
ncbi:unnamed protein product [Trichobilharzia szidati]|nr:unnamed protein product [Trichobilharzia szidati]